MGEHVPGSFIHFIRLSFANDKQTMPDHSPYPTTVDIELKGGEMIAFGNVRLQVLDTPGHTLGSTCYLIERAGLRVFFAGDVIVRLGDKPLDTNTTYMAPRYRGDAKSY